MVKYLTDELKQQIYNIYIDPLSRLSAGDLARKYQTCDKTIYRIIREYGGNPNKKQNQNKQNQYPKQQKTQISETPNKFGSSEPDRHYVNQPTPGRKGSKSSEVASELARKARQEAVDKGLVSEFHYEDIAPRRSSKEQQRRGSNEKIETEELPFFDIDKVYDAKNRKFSK